MRAQSGFSLIEVLVALTILVVGLLGLAGLQLATLRWSADASQTAAVARLGQELAEKLRSHPRQVDAFITAAAARDPASASCYGAGGCLAAQSIATDLAEWREQVANALPGGEATICRDATPADGSTAAPACSGGATDPVVMKFWWAARDTRGRSTEVAALLAPVAYLPVRQ